MDYEAAVKTAEAAVSSMKDPKLKGIAFGQILAQLLSGGKQESSRTASSSRKSSAAIVAKQTVAKKKDGTTAWIRDLAIDEFFKTPRNSKAILAKLEEQSHHLVGSDLTRPLQQLCHSKVLRRKKIAPAEGKAATWHWSNW